MRRSLPVPLLASVAAALVLAVPAAAETGNPQRFELDWVEHARKNGRVVMTFRVEQVHFQFRAFSAQIEFHNRSGRTIRIKPQFALLVSRTKGQDPSYQALVVRRSQPRLPTILFPGQRWRGAVAGPGRPRGGTWIRFNFGYFAVKGLYADSPDGFAWITDHSFRVAHAA